MASEFFLLASLLLIGIVFFSIFQIYTSIQSSQTKEAEVRTDAEIIASLIYKISKDPSSYLQYCLNVPLSNITVENGVLRYESRSYKFAFLIPEKVEKSELVETTKVCFVKKGDTIILSKEKEVGCNFNGICEAEECKSNCPDCYGPNSICLNDGFCNINIGENCKNSADCSCNVFGLNYVCCPENPSSNKYGCVYLSEKKKKGQECYCDEECGSNLKCNPVDSSFTAYKKACCEEGKSWNGSECIEGQINYCPSDTPCKRGWPGHKGELLFINEPNFACDLFEICHPTTQKIVEESYKCCINECNGDCHSYCKEALKYSGYDNDKSNEKLKYCMGLYITSGFGPARRWMFGYDLAEVCCAGIDYCLEAGGKPDYLGKCLPLVEGTPLDKLPCKGKVSIYPVGWKSDSNIEENSCYFSDLPAHVNYGILKTGVCADYSVAVTTALRAAGYKKDEVFTAVGPMHAYNIVKFPGQNKYVIIDTTGNNGANWRPGQDPTNWYPHCKYYECMNDNGYFNCPPKSEVWGC